MSNNEIQVMKEKSSNENIDLLNRAEFIDSVINYINYYSDLQKSISFSINGEWGSGKSWVIDNLINKLYEIQSEDTYSDKFCVFKYNAWNYDYYEEPLIALIIAIKEQIDCENAVFINTPKEIEKSNAIKNVIKKESSKLFSELLDNAAKIKIIPFTPVSTNITMVVKTIGLFGSKLIN